jgi:hypothetical protein
MVPGSEEKEVFLDFIQSVLEWMPQDRRLHCTHKRNTMKRKKTAQLLEPLVNI